MEMMNHLPISFTTENYTAFHVPAFQREQGEQVSQTIAVVDVVRVVHSTGLFSHLLLVVAHNIRVESECSRPIQLEC